MTGEWTVDFYDGETPCKTYEIDLQKSRAARRYASYGLIAADLELLLNWVGEYLEQVVEYEREHPESAGDKEHAQVERNEAVRANIMFSLFASICVIYGRLFTSSGEGVVKLEKSAFVEPIHSTIHDELMNARHRYIAHRDDKSYEGFKSFIVSNPEDASQFMIVYETNRVAFNGSTKIMLIEDHLKALLRRVTAKIEKLRIVLFEAHQRNELCFLHADDSKLG